MSRLCVFFPKHDTKTDNFFKSNIPKQRYISATPRLCSLLPVSTGSLAHSWISIFLLHKYVHAAHSVFPATSQWKKTKQDASSFKENLGFPHLSVTDIWGLFFPQTSNITLSSFFWLHSITVSFFPALTHTDTFSVTVAVGLMKNDTKNISLSQSHH